MSLDLASEGSPIAALIKLDGEPFSSAELAALTEELDGLGAEERVSMRNANAATIANSGAPKMLVVAGPGTQEHSLQGPAGALVRITPGSRFDIVHDQEIRHRPSQQRALIFRERGAIFGSGTQTARDAQCGGSIHFVPSDPVRERAKLVCVGADQPKGSAVDADGIGDVCLSAAA